MSWKCFMVDSDDPVAQQKPGAMWFADEGYPYFADYVSEKYTDTWRDKRPPICVRIPSSEVFCVDARPSDGAPGWDVSGDAPNITVAPSINIIGRYHGWIRNGVITDDCEGRTFP